MATKKSVGKGNAAQKVVLGAGLVAMAAAGYLLFGPKGKQNRQKIKGWTLRAKGEVLEALESMEHVTEDKYKTVVDRVAKKYAKAKNTTSSEVKKFETEARKYWKNIEKDLAGKAKKTTTKTAKKATKTRKKK
jgi:hypothetical protein